MPGRNIVVVMSDDHGQWCSGPYGNEEIQTPTLDFMAERGIRMENAFCPTPVCSPARASFATGRRPSQHGVHDWIRIADDDGDREWLADEDTIPELLGDAGYRTGLAGKWHCGHTAVPEQFDEVHSIHHSDDFEGSRFSLKRDRCVADGAVEMIDDFSSEERPFFLFVGFAGTHGGWDGEPERLVAQYEHSGFEDIPEDTTYRYGDGDVIRRDDPQLSLANYYAAVQGIDEQVGRLFDTLDDAGELENTVTVYTADHGHNCGHHGIWGKGNGTVPQNMLEESIRVPLIVGPHGGVEGRQVREEFVDHCDLFQTLLDAAGVEPPADRAYPGQSYWRQLSRVGGDPSWEQVQIGEYGDVRMIRTERYKLVRRYFDAPDLLFDLEHDPRETRNVIDDPAHEHVVSGLKRQLQAAFEQYSEPGNEGVSVGNLPDYNQGSEPWNRRR